MKKTLIALAVLAASTASMAQVTLYGVADVSVGGTNAPGAKSDWQMHTGNNAGNIWNDGASRVGFRVTEDLGGGMKVNANFEMGVGTETGATDAVTFQRNAWAEIAGGFGSVRAGRTLSPSFFGTAAWELTGTANFSAVANQFGFGGGSSRNNSQFSYTTPSMGGVSATLGYVTEGDLAVAPKSDVSKVDANVIYAGGPLSVGLSYNKISNASEAGYGLGANYNFGSFSIAGSFQDAAGPSQGYTIGASLPMGAWKFVVDVAQDTGAEDTNFVAYAGYSLSKRTTVYVQNHRDGKSSSKTFVKSAADVDTTSIGVRHNF